MVITGSCDIVVNVTAYMAPCSQRVLIPVVQNDRYLILTAQLYDTKEMAAAAKTKGDKMGQRMAQDRIRIIQQGDRALSPTWNNEKISSNCPPTITEQLHFSVNRNEAAGVPPHVQPSY